MRFLPDAKSWRAVFVLALALFLFSRLATLMVFPIFNDESIYLQYSQTIHANWHENKFTSMNSSHGDWKPPLQYWMAAPMIEWGNDPLVVGRSVALAVSLLGFFGFYGFARELFGDREGALTAFLYVLCPPVLFHNDEFIAETFLFSTAPFVYWSLLKAMEPGARHRLWGIVALFFAVALLLFKQSGLLLLGVAIFLPLARLKLGKQNESNESSDSASKACDWRRFAINLSLVTVVVVCALVVVNTLIPTGLNARRDRFYSDLLLSLKELIHLPTGIWRTNLNVLGDYVTSYYSWFVPIFFGVFVWLALRKKNLAELALAAMCLAGAIGLTFLLRHPNEYLFNTAVIVVLLPLLARTGLLVWNFARSGPIRLTRIALLGFAAITIMFWSYQDVLMAVSPGRFFERSTPWAVANYLAGWPTGFGVKEIVAILQKEKQPGIILADPQWGNPRTALEVYQNTFPNLRVVSVRRQMVDPAAAREFREMARKAGPARFVIFSAANTEPRPEWQSSIERELCADHTEVKVYPAQTPIIVCRF